MTPETPDRLQMVEDRLSTVEKHSYTVQATIEGLDAIATLAHLTERHDLGFLIGMSADMLRRECDVILAAATIKRGLS